MDKALYVKRLCCFQEGHSQSTKLRTSCMKEGALSWTKIVELKEGVVPCTRTVELISTLSSYLQEFDRNFANDHTLCVQWLLNNLLQISNSLLSNCCKI